MRRAWRVDHATSLEGRRILLRTVWLRALSRRPIRDRHALRRRIGSDRDITWGKISVKPSKPAEVVGYAAELPKQFGFAELAHHRVTGAAEGDRADAAG